MKKLGSKGFSVLGSLVIILVIGLLIGVGWYVQKQSAKIETPNSQQTENSNSTSEEDSDSYQGWKTYVSKIDGFSFKYPSDWILQEQEIFKNDNGGESETVNVYSTTPQREKNIYFCINVLHYKGNWTVNSSLTDSPDKEETLKIGGKELILALFEPGPSMKDSRLQLIENRERYINISSEQKLEVVGLFNCAQGDGSVLAGNNDKFEERPEVTTAKKIIKSFNIN